jgi:hypothetical protein
MTVLVTCLAGCGRRERLALTGGRPLTETRPLDEVGAAYNGMLSGDARYRLGSSPPASDPDFFACSHAPRRIGGNHLIPLVCSATSSGTLLRHSRVRGGAGS